VGRVKVCGGKKKTRQAAMGAVLHVDAKGRSVAWPGRDYHVGNCGQAQPHFSHTSERGITLANRRNHW
jgi:hypothetical protein